MGMFDRIDTGGPVPCPECGADVTGFQSKDGDCLMHTLHWTTVSVFYASCDKCGRWVEYRREAERERPRFDGYTETGGRLR